ncbi:MAG TPA: SDR family oxidoreductase [Elusimicrobiota bacterium]|nr:SDR family oxidoreductase [Elusimicrobiota bacterium]
MDPKGKTALITGAARVGGAVAEALAARGCRVALSYRSSRNAAEKTARAIQRRGGETLLLRADLARDIEARRLVAAVLRRWGRLDVLINMASLYERTSLAALRRPGAATRALRRSLSVDLESAHRLAHVAAPAMEKNGAGRIINFTDWVAASGRPRYKGYGPYYIAKAAVKGLTETLALELAPRVLVNAIAPGPILAPAGLSRAAHREVIDATPLRRWGGPAEVAKAVLFLVETDFVTGETLRVDGGRHLS